jgi:DHA2 family multidrug resistance protein
VVGKVDQRLLVGFGFVVVGWSSFLLSGLNLQVAMSNIVPANILNGFGAGFVFVPLMTVSLGTLRNEQMGNATALQNLLRNIGGSIGLSLVATLLERCSQAHQALMVAHLSPLNPLYQQRLGLLQRVFESHFSPVDALQRARAALYRTLLQQADYWSYVDLFYLIVWLCAICAVAAMFFKNVKPHQAAGGAEL